MENLQDVMLSTYENNCVFLLIIFRYKAINKTSCVKMSSTSGDKANDEITAVSSPNTPLSSTNDPMTVDDDENEEEKRRKQEEQLELVVIKYLKQKGYKKALDSLKQEATTSSASISDMIVNIEKEDALTSTDKELLNDYLDTTNVQRSNRYVDG
jgi:hypothetical protein